MNKCKYLKRCANLFSNNSHDKITCDLNRPMSIIKYFRNEYCYKNPEKCARYQILSKLSVDDLPPDLLPYEIKRAENIINK